MERHDSYVRYKKEKEEPEELKIAKLNAPQDTRFNLIFYWDYQSDCFEFGNVLRIFRNDYQKLKHSHLKHVSEDELVKLNSMLEQSKHYLPSKPDSVFFIYFPWYLLAMFLLGAMI